MEVKKKIKFIYIKLLGTSYKRCLFLIAIFLSFTAFYPTVTFDASISYNHLKQYYKWLTFEIYYPIYEESRKYKNITEEDLCAIIQNESGNYCHNNSECMKKVISYAGAIGLMQIMPFHHKGNKQDLYNPNLNIMYGARYYSWCLTYAKGDKKEALRYYNAGPFSIRNNYKNWTYVYNIISKSCESKILLEQLLQIF